MWLRGFDCMDCSWQCEALCSGKEWIYSKGENQLITFSTCDHCESYLVYKCGLVILI